MTQRLLLFDHPSPVANSIFIQHSSSHPSCPLRLQKSTFHLGAVISSWATWPVMDFSMMLC